MVDPKTPNFKIRPVDLTGEAKKACALNFEDAKSTYPFLAKKNIASFVCMDLIYQYVLLVDGFGKFLLWKLISFYFYELKNYDIMIPCHHFFMHSQSHDFSGRPILTVINVWLCLSVTMIYNFNIDSFVRKYCCTLQCFHAIIASILLAGLDPLHEITSGKEIEYQDAVLEAAWPLGNAVEAISSLPKFERMMYFV